MLFRSKVERADPGALDRRTPAASLSVLGSGRSTSESTWGDFAYCAALVLLGGAFLWDARHWAATVYVGGDQYGDAQFWWDGALHFSQGIVAGNPNLLYRMGYAAFAGAFAAVFGSNFLVFHKLLIAIFLFASAALYCRLRTEIGRIAAAAAAALLVFNPYTAEWLAISSSDSLGMILNLGAILALNHALRMAEAPRRRLRWLAAAGGLLAAASLTRPLMTLMVLPAGLAIWAAAGWSLRKAAGGWTALAAPFLALTFSWMGLMAVLSGNFAISGSSQDASIFYAASDPHIQIWNPAMYPAVENAARARYRDHALTPARANREFWRETEENYLRYWRYHLSRLGPHLVAIARLTPVRATAATPATNRLRLELKLAFGLLLAAGAAVRKRRLGAVAALLLGAAWAWWPPFQLYALLFFAAAGLAAVFFRRPAAFVWASYWWIGAAALYLTGGTWGPPLGAVTDLNALGYRLGFQFFFTADILIVGGIAWCSGIRMRYASEVERPDPRTLSDDAGWRRSSAQGSARSTFSIVSRTAAILLVLILVLGSAKVAWRMIERAHTRPLAYPDLAVLAREWAASHATPPIAPAPGSGLFYEYLRKGGGARFLTAAMSSGFVWNLPGQDRCLLLLYEQEEVRPVRMAPYSHLVEVPSHLSAGTWRLRQGAWLLRSFSDAPDRSNQAYYVQVAAVQAFIPLAADGRSYDIGRARVFPLAKYASQLDADGELGLIGAEPRWAVDSGGEQFPRRLGLEPRSATEPVVLRLDLGRARGRKTLHFGWQVESGGTHDKGLPTLEVAADVPTSPGGLRRTSPAAAIWTSTEPEVPPPGRRRPPSAGGHSHIHWVSLPLPDVPAVRLVARNLKPTDTLWLYEFTLTADDYLP